MYFIHVAIYLVLITASYLAWKKYKNKFMLWCLWVGFGALSASTWLYSVENIVQVPEAVETFSFYVVQALRLVLFIFIVITGIRAFRH